MYDLLAKIGLEQPRGKDEYTDLGAILKASPARKCIVVSVGYMAAGFGLGAQEEAMVRAENDHTASECAKFPGRAFGFASVNPLKEYAVKELDRALSLPGIYGIKLHCDNSKLSMLDSKHVTAVRNVFELAHERRVPLLVHLDDRSPEYGAKHARAFVDDVLRKVGQVELYVAHLGTGGGYDASTRDVLAVFEDALPKLSHRIYFDVSGVAMPTAFRTIQPITDEQASELVGTMRRMGIGRFVFGTDYSVTDATTYRDWLRKRLPLTDSEFDALMGNTGALMRDPPKWSRGSGS